MYGPNVIFSEAVAREIISNLPNGQTYVIYRVNIRYPPDEHQQPAGRESVICRTNNS